jgi:RNA polymerase sigma factor (sigma-70 family)
VVGEIPIRYVADISGHFAHQPSSMQTRASLLLRIRDPRDRLAWAEFARLYAPLLHAYGLKHQLQDADAADLAQETLRNVLRAAPDFVYDPARGSFRGWLYTIARNEIRKAGARAAVRAVTGGSAIRELLDAAPDRESDREEWDREYRLNLFQWAAERVRVEFREATWQAFWRTAVGGEGVTAVAADLGMSTGGVYVARSRVTSRIRQEIRAVGEDE